MPNEVSGIKISRVVSTSRDFIMTCVANFMSFSDTLKKGHTGELMLPPVRAPVTQAQKTVSLRHIGLVFIDFFDRCF